MLGWVSVVPVVLGLLVLAPAGAHAQGRDRDERAQGLYRAGETAFHAGEYEAAFDLFRSAFELSHRPGLLHNMALAADRLRRDQDAAQYYGEYLERVPDAANRSEVEARLRALRQAIARHEQAPPVESAQQAPPVPAASAEVTSEPWFWPVVLGGAALVVAGVVTGIVVGTQPIDEPYRTGDIGGVIFALQGTF